MYLNFHQEWESLSSCLFPSSSVILRPGDNLTPSDAVGVWSFKDVINPRCVKRSSLALPQFLIANWIEKLVGIRSQNIQVPFWSLQDRNDLNRVPLSSPAAPAAGTVTLKSIFEGLQMWVLPTGLSEQHRAKFSSVHHSWACTPLSE